MLNTVYFLIIVCYNQTNIGEYYSTICEIFCFYGGKKMKGNSFKKILTVVTSLVLVLAISVGSAVLIYDWRKESVAASTTVKDGLSAYELAVQYGYEGTVQEWLDSLNGKSAYEIAKENGYTGTETEWTTSLKATAGKDGVGIKTAAFSDKNELLITLTDGSVLNLGVANGLNGEDGKDGKDGADGKDGKDGDSFFQGVDTSNSNYVILTLADGTEIKLPTWYAFEQLQKLCNQMNTNIASLQTIVGALQNNDYIQSITPLMENGKEVGYTITFTKSGAVIIYHGKDGANGNDGQNGTNGVDGKDGHTPQIGVKQDTDGIYYWTVDGEWLLDDNGNKIKAVGTDGKDGQDGANGNDGQNGTNGTDGITPKLKIENGYWYVSYDDGAT